MKHSTAVFLLSSALELGGRSCHTVEDVEQVPKSRFEADRPSGFYEHPIPAVTRLRYSVTLRTSGSPVCP